MVSLSTTILYAFKKQGDTEQNKVMKTILAIPLRSTATDSASSQAGMLTHTLHNEDGSIRYILQPKGLNSKTGQPLKKIYLEGSRLIDVSAVENNLEIPLEILGTIVTDTASGYTGKAIQLIRHTHGCVHVLVQSKTVTDEGESVDPQEFNLIQLEGEAIKKLTPEEEEVEIKARPSPTAGKLPGEYMPG